MLFEGAVLQGSHPQDGSGPHSSWPQGCSRQSGFASLGPPTPVVSRTSTRNCRVGRWAAVAAVAPALLSEISTRRDRHHLGAGIHPGRIDPQQCAKAVRNLSVAFVGGVLVAQCRRVSPVSESVHQFGERGAGNWMSSGGLFKMNF